MKVLIAGSRSIKEFDIHLYIPKETKLIICGGASGVDELAEKYADKNKISKFVLRPNYKQYKRAAPLKRNEEMVEMADLVIVAWDGVSKGTKYTIDYAKKKSKDINLIIVEKKSQKIH